MHSSKAVLIAALLTAFSASTANAQSSPSPSPASPLPAISKALSGKWKLDVRFEAGPSTGSKVVQGPGEESWGPGPGGINLIEKEHIPTPWGDSFLMGLIWFDGTKKQLAGMECNSALPFICDLKGGLNDITITWDGKKFQIDEMETHNGKHTVWHEYWTNITADSFDQIGDVTQPDGTTSRFMTIHGKRVHLLKTIAVE